MTDRTLDAHALDDLTFAGPEGLVPVVAQDADTGTVLMVAWADRTALERSLDTGLMHFWSRSRRSLWRKGETSGNELRLVSLHADCDGDTVLARVEPTGPACHTGETSCFGDGAYPAHHGPPRPPPPPEDSLPGASPSLGRIVDELAGVIDDRAARRPAGSWTTRLLSDPNLRLKKLGEETAELVAALASGDADGAREEGADLLYHLLVALQAAGVGPDRLAEALAERRS